MYNVYYIAQYARNADKSYNNDKNFSQAPAIFNENDRRITMHPYLEEISDIDEIHETITYKMFLVLFWTDSRVVLNRDMLNTTGFIPVSLELG